MYDPYDGSDYILAEDAREKEEEVKGWLEEAIHCVYNTGNAEGLCEALCELSSIFDASFPSKECRLQKKPAQLFDNLVQLSKKNRSFCNE